MFFVERNAQCYASNGWKPDVKIIFVDNLAWTDNFAKYKFYEQYSFFGFFN